MKTLDVKTQKAMRELDEGKVRCDCNRTFEDVVASLPRFLDEFYNSRRLHSPLAYRSSARFEQEHIRQMVKSTA